MFKPFGIEHFAKKKETKEADAASSFPALTRANRKKKESAAARTYYDMRLIEAEANPSADPQDPTRFRVTLIQEGLGNFGSCYFYTKECLQLAATQGIFEGKKAFSNHPTETEEVDRPERDVRDVFGHYENVAYQESAGRGCLMADLVTISDPAFDRERAYLEHSVEYSQKYPNQDFMGLSINANGDATEVPIDQFIQQNVLSDSVKAKLAEAQAMGITIIRPVARLTSAESVDLVTEAGAGGSIDQMLEQENPMKKFHKFLESKEKESKKDESEKKEADPAAAAPPAEGAKEDAGDGDPKDGEDPDGDGDDDADQDRELLKSFLAKYLGDGHDEETYEMAKEAIGAAKELYEDENEAMKCAGHSMQMAKHMAGKKEGAPAPAPGGENPAPKPPKAPAPAAGQPPAQKQAGDPSNLSPESKKESDRIVKLTAENASLKEKIRKMELTGVEGTLDRMLRESGLPMSATKKFREAIGEPKNEDEIKKSLKIFKEAYGSGGEADPLSGFGIPEKHNLREAGSKGGLDLSDCVRKQD